VASKITREEKPVKYKLSDDDTMISEQMDNPNGVEGAGVLVEVVRPPSGLQPPSRRCGYPFVRKSFYLHINEFVFYGFFFPGDLRCHTDTKKDIRTRIRRRQLCICRARGV
jgi:hypothetical protein